MIYRLVRCAESEEVGAWQGVLRREVWRGPRAQSCEELAKPWSTVIDGPEPRRRTKTLRSAPPTMSATRSPARHHFAGLTTDHQRSFRGEWMPGTRRTEGEVPGSRHRVEALPEEAPASFRIQPGAAIDGSS